MTACKVWCGLCYENKKGRGNHRAHYGYREPRPQRRVDMSQYVTRKVAKSTEAGAVPPQAPTGELGEYYPALAEWMTLTVLDGKERQPATLLLFTEGAVWKARILDREGDEQAFITGRTLVELIDTLEAGLVNGGLDWRKVGVWKGKK